MLGGPTTGWPSWASITWPPIRKCPTASRTACVPCRITLLIRSHIPNVQDHQHQDYHDKRVTPRPDPTFVIVKWYSESCPVPSKLGRRYDTPCTSRSWWTPLHWRRCGCVPNWVAGRWVRLRYTNPLAHPVIKPKPFRTSFNDSNTASRHNTRPLPADARAEVIKFRAVRWQDVLLVLHSGTVCSPLFTARARALRRARRWEMVDHRLRAYVLGQWLPRRTAPVNRTARVSFLS